jgi:hypothetical protein
LYCLAMGFMRLPVHFLTRTPAVSSLHAPSTPEQCIGNLMTACAARSFSGGCHDVVYTPHAGFEAWYTCAALEMNTLQLFLLLLVSNFGSWSGSEEKSLYKITPLRLSDRGACACGFTCGPGPGPWLAVGVRDRERICWSYVRSSS